VFDAMFSDMDTNLRELGVSDMRLAKNMRAMWEAFHGRATVYEQALEDPDPATLEAALARNIWRGGEAAGADRLAAIVRRTVAQLATEPAADLLAGRVRFAGPAPL
jgi:cytochrome b pre-mRNA-processing protein 3